MVSSKRYGRDLLVLVLLVLAITLPFAHRAFHLDDGYFLRQAEIISRFPLRPFREDPTAPYLFYDRSSGKASDAQQPPAQNPIYQQDFPPSVVQKLKDGTLGFVRAMHPPLLPYFMALVMNLRGDLTERSQHIAYQIFTLLAALTAYALARRFTRFPLWATLFFMGTCVFVLSAHSLMSDMPMVAFFQAAVWCYVTGIDRTDRRFLLASGLFMALAFLTRYAAGILLPVLLVYGVLKKARPAHMLLPFLLFFALYGAWEIPNVVRYGRPHLLASASAAYDYVTYVDNPSKSKLVWAVKGSVTRGIAFTVAIGSLFIFPLSALLALVRSRRQGLIYGALLLGGWILVRRNTWTLFPNYSVVACWLVAWFWSLGVFLLGRLLVAALRMGRAAEWKSAQESRDDLFLLLWLLMVLGASILALPFATPRYLLPLSFPLIALFVNQAAIVYRDARRRTRFLGASAGFMLLLSLNVALADYQQAGIYRRFVRTHVPTYREYGSRIWYVSGWGGFRHYMDQAGGQDLPMNFNLPMPGELIIVPSVARFYGLSPWLMDRVSHVESISYSIPTPLRLFDKSLHAGYYTHYWGLLPFYFSGPPAEQFDTYVVTKGDYFWRNFIRAQRQISGLGELRLGYMTIQGKTYITLFEHPTARISYRLVIPYNTLLSFNVGLSPEVWRPDMGDGVLFELTLAQTGAVGSAPAQVLFSKYIDPKHNPEDRAWHPASVDLTPYGGQEVMLTLATQPGPHNNAYYDWAGWGNLEFRPKNPPRCARRP